MTRVAEIPLEGGGTILMEVAAATPAVRGRGGLDVLAIEEPLDRMLAGLGPTTRVILDQLAALADAPQEIEVEFGVKLSADARIIIASAGGEATFRIAMRWSRPAP